MSSHTCIVAHNREQASCKGDQPLQLLIGELGVQPANAGLNMGMVGRRCQSAALRIQNSKYRHHRSHLLASTYKHSIMTCAGCYLDCQLLSRVRACKDAVRRTGAWKAGAELDEKRPSRLRAGCWSSSTFLSQSCGSCMFDRPEFCNHRLDLHGLINNCG